MPIEHIQSLLEKASTCEGRRIKSDMIGLYQDELKKVLWEKNFLQIVSAKTGVKNILLQALETELSREIATDIINPQSQAQQAAITRQEINKVDRLRYNAKLHLLWTNSLMNNIQLAFSDPRNYVEYPTDKFTWMTREQIQDEIRRAIRNYIVINPLKAKNLYQKLWLSISLDDTQTLKKLLSEAKTYTYTRSIKVWSFKEKQTPRITYIQGYPMLFGKNLVHVPYGHDATRAEKSKYDIDTSAKIFDDFYSLVRAHSHIQDSEQEGIQSLTDLNTIFAKAKSIIKDKNKREELELLIQDIIAQLSAKKDSKISKAKTQDLEHILQTHHITQNENKLLAAWKKVRERITSQQSIKHTVAAQQNALYEDLAQQEIHARELIKKLQWHIENFNTKNRSARTLAQSYQDKLYAKPFFDIHDHIIQLEDQVKPQKWIPYKLKKNITINLLMHRSHITLLYLYNQYTTHNSYIPEEKWFDTILNDLNNSTLDPKDKELYLSPYIDMLEKIRHTAIDKETFAKIREDAKIHTQQSRKTLLNS